MTSLAKINFDYVFIDWHGVAGNRGFWCNQSKINPYLSIWCKKIFGDKDILDSWMRGSKSFSELVDEYAKDIDLNSIIKLFDEDMNEYGPNTNLLEAINTMFPNSNKVLFSDNMDIYIQRIFRKNKYLMNYFMSSIISCEHGFLKLDSPTSLFHIALRKLKLKSFSNCLLVDDSIENCKKFAELGGRFILIN